MSFTIIQPDLHTDRETILAFWRRNLPDAAESRFDWLYRTDRASSWIVRGEAGDAVGSIGLMRRAMKIFNQDGFGGQPIDLNVDRRYRMGGAAIELQRTVTAEVDQGRLGLIYGFPNAKSEPVLRRVGYRVFSQVGRWALPLACEEFLPSWIGHGVARKILSTPIDAALRLASPDTFHRRPKHWRVEVTDRFDTRFDRLWEIGRERYAIVGCRTADYLSWRFGQCPDAIYRVFCLSDRDDRLLAYLVYSQRDRIAYVADFFFAELRHFDVLLSEFIRVMRQQRALAIVTLYIGAAEVAGRLIHFGFRRRPSTWNALVHAPHDGRFLDEENWFLTRADFDTDF